LEVNILKSKGRTVIFFVGDVFFRVELLRQQKKINFANIETQFFYYNSEI
jgi:hypothetical protein